MRLYHVTYTEAAEDIRENGFLGGWGDAGFGVYFYDSLRSAERYADAGGWDGGLEDPVVLEVLVGSHEVERVVPEPSWPNPEKYLEIWWHPMDEDDEDAYWRPREIRLPYHDWRPEDGV